MTLEESHTQAKKIIKTLSQNSYKFRRGFEEVPGIAFLGHVNAEYALTVGHVTLSLVLRTLK
jgi:hypothetical protein